jgi:hypothetical protein
LTNLNIEGLGASDGQSMSQCSSWSIDNGDAWRM